MPDQYELSKSETQVLAAALTAGAARGDWPEAWRQIARRLAGQVNDADAVWLESLGDLGNGELADNDDSNKEL